MEVKADLPALTITSRFAQLQSRSLNPVSGHPRSAPTFVCRLPESRKFRTRDLHRRIDRDDLISCKSVCPGRFESTSVPIGPRSLRVGAQEQLRSQGILFRRVRIIAVKLRSVDRLLAVLRLLESASIPAISARDPLHKRYRAKASTAPRSTSLPVKVPRSNDRSSRMPTGSAETSNKATRILSRIRRLPRTSISGIEMVFLR